MRNHLVGLWRENKQAQIRQRRNQRYFLVHNKILFKSAGMAPTEKLFRTSMNRNFKSCQNPTMTTFMRIVNHYSFRNTCDPRRKIGKNKEHKMPLRLQSLINRMIRKINRVRRIPRRAKRIRGHNQDEECHPWLQAPTVETLIACERSKRKRDSSD